MAKPKRAVLELRLRVAYDLNGETPEALGVRLSALVDHATNRGLLTEGTGSEIYCYIHQVVDQKTQKVMYGAENMKVG